MKLKWVILGLMLALSLVGCTPVVQPSSEAIPTLAPPPVENFERSGPITVSPVRLALGASTEVKVDGLKPEEMKDKGIALLDPQGNKLQTVVGLGPTQSLTIPAEAQPGSYKVWLADSSFAPNSGVTIVLLDVYDPVPAPLRNPDPTKILETYIQAITQKDYGLAWQCLVGVAGQTQETWSKAMEQNVESLTIQRYTQVQSAPKANDNQFKIQVEITAKLKPNMSSSEWSNGKNIRFVTFSREKQGWRISRMATTP